MNQHDEEFLRKAAEARARVAQVAPEQVDARLASGTVVIDVREQEEHLKSTVPGAINIARGSLAQRIASAVPDKASPVICFCNGGNRGPLAAAELLDMGYTNVSTISGGLRAYVAFKNQK